MITDALLDLAMALLSFLSQLLPDWSIDAFANWSLLSNNLAALNYYLPITEVFAFTLSILYLFPLFLAASGFLWLAAFIRGGSARG